MSKKLAVFTIALTIFLAGCLGAVVAAAGAGSALGVGALQKASTGSVALDNVVWSRGKDDSTRLIARGLLTWKPAPGKGPNGSKYLDLTGQSPDDARGVWHIELLDANGKLLTTSRAATITVLEGKTEITMVPRGTAYPFELATESVPWNVLRDTRNTTVRFEVMAPPPIIR